MRGGLLALLFLLAACGSVSPKLASASLIGASVKEPSPVTAGYIAYAPGTYTEAQVTFYVPGLNKAQTVPGAKVAYAVAIGNANQGGAIVDGGIYSYLDASGNQINKAYWEFGSPTSPALIQTADIPFDGNGNGGGVVDVNDPIYVYVKSDYYNGSFSDTIFVQDMKTQDSFEKYLSGYEYMPDRSGAGCLVLSPLSAPTPLADFGGVQMLQCQVAEQSQTLRHGYPVMTPIGTYQPIAYQMIGADGNSGLLRTSYPIDLENDGQTFAINWQHS